MNQPSSTGTCNLCGRAFGRVGMTRHLKTCRQPGSAEAQPCFHLHIEPRYNKAYWIHAAIPVDTALVRLDAFLREIWLECCGHLSAFTIDGNRYRCQAMKQEFGGSGMEARLNRILRVGTRFTYEYDFGSTTALSLKIIGLREELPAGNPVHLLARNDPPQIACDQCGDRPARQICTECASGDGGWLCDTCLDDHPCDPNMCLPVVNSPRAGVCAYTG